MTESHLTAIPDIMPTQLSPSPLVKWTILIGRFVLGYILAVGAGALAFSVVTFFVAPGSTISPFHTGAGRMLDQIWSGFVMYFMLGLMFGLPYTILGSLVFTFALPRNWLTFMLIGTLCPTVAIFTLGLALGGTFWWGAEMLKTLLMTLPAGVIATYLFGAIGFGLGFRGWRFQ